MWGGGGLHSHFHVKPNRCVLLCWGWGFDNIVTKVIVLGTCIINYYIHGDAMSSHPLFPFSFCESSAKDVLAHLLMTSRRVENLSTSLIKSLNLLTGEEWGEPCSGTER